MLLTKTHIPSPGINTVLRPELYEKLSAGLRRKLILISAPAGFGKTTLVSDWVHQQKIPTAWISLDKGDNDPVVYLSYIIAAIQSVERDFGQSALSLLQSPNKPSAESIASLLINDILQIEHHFILVLDDFHFINSKEILELTAYFLQHITENIHLLILTRSDPALPVARLRSQHQLVELRLADLSFSANDISILFNKKLKIGLSIDDVYSLETKTEGWAAGLQLTALSLQGRGDVSGFIQDLKGDNQYIMDYLMEEVLKTQPEEIKEFLLQTSLLEQISGPLCDAVLNRNDSQLILESLVKNNMFVISLDDDRNWFRYHHLFSDLLKQKLQVQNRGAMSEIHYKACTWFEQHGFIDFAIGHAVAVPDYAKSIQLIGEVVEEKWENGQHAAILKYGDLLPEELVKKNADFCLYYAWILIIAGQIKKSQPYLSSAEEISSQIISDKNSSKEEVRSNRKLSGKISVAFAYLNSLISNAEKIYDYSKKAMEILSEDDPLWYSWAQYSMGIAEMFRENFSESCGAFESALVYAKKSGNFFLLSTIACRLSALEARMGIYSVSYLRCSDLISFMKESGYSQIIKSEPIYTGLYAYMAGVESMRTDFDDALESLKMAYSLCKQETDNTFKVNMLVVYALTLFGRGDITGANKMLHEADHIVNHNTIFPSSMAMYIAMKGFMLIQQNERYNANQLYIENGLKFDDNISYSNDLGYYPYALLLILEGKFGEAEILLSKLLNMVLTANRIERIIETKVIYAVLNQATKDREKAVTNLIEALEYAAAENILMSFILYHSQISDLLKDVFRIQATGTTKIPKKLVDKLKLAIETRQNRIAIATSVGLSTREIDTLKLIANDLSNQEIADQLFISLNTVKTHLKNIFLKLHADSRSKAVAKAKEIGLL